MDFSPSSIAALIVAVSLAAGLNVYATVATLGVLAHFNWVALPRGLDALAHPWIIFVASILFAVEVFADKVPGFDLVWNAAHTFIRLPLAAFLAYRAADHLSPELKLLAALAGAAIAGLAHSSKTAARVLVTPSPEPVSNIALSAGEDVVAVSLTWLATRHPYVGGGIAMAIVVVLVLSLRWMVKGVRRLGQRFRGELCRSE
jgi:hypothetical protein